METLTKRRGGFRARCTVMGQSLTTELAKPTPDLETIESYHLELLRLRDSILDLDSQILELTTENSDQEIADSSDKMMKVNLFISRAAKALLPPPSQDQLAQNPNNRNHQSYHQNQNRNAVFAKLPQLYLLKFDGDPLSWNSFWELFKTSVHDRTDLPAPSKFQYLIGQLQGEALKLVNGFSHTAEEYAEAIDLLVKTYGDKKILIQSRLNALFDIPSPEPTAESLSEFRSDYEGHLRVLKTLGTDVEASGFVFAHLLMRKLPVTTRDNLNRANTAESWSLQVFRDSIKVEIDNLAALNDKPCKSNLNIKTKFTPTASFPNVSKSVKSRSCQLCKGEHLIFNCSTYETPKSRSDRVKALKLCFNCLMSNHTVAQCLNSNSCRVCQKRHHTSLHKNSKSENSKTVKNKTDESPAEAQLVSTSSAQSHSLNRTSILPTADVILTNDKISVKGKALLDTGSQRSFVLKSVVQSLKLKSHKTLDLKIDGFQSKGKTETYGVVNLPIHTDEGIITIEACVVTTMVDRIYMPGRESLISQIKSSGYQLADKTSVDKFDRIDLLIGVDHYFKFVHGENLVDDIYQVSSKLGTLIMGTIYDGNADNASVSTVLRVGVSDTKDDQNLNKLWELETIGISKPETDDRVALEKFQSSLKFDGTKYYANLPWRNDTVKLPSNISMAYSRMKSMWSTLKKDLNKLNHYDSVIKNQLERGFIEEVTDCTVASKRTHYLPHHFVEKNSETTPLRVVFDCSAKTGQNSYSLNDCLLTGPSLVHHMASILLRFRLDDFMCSADIEKAFLMVGLNPDDRDSCRFFWPENVHDENSKIKTYRFCVVLFGSTASQFLLNSTLIHHLSKYDSIESKKLQRNIYIDNVLASFNSESLMKKFFSDAIKIMSDGGFTLREWVSNSTKFNENLPNEYRNKSDTHRILGVDWDVKNDEIKLTPFVPPSDFVPTKREVLKFVSKTFDIYGILLPITITSKLLIQDIWSNSIGWDEKIPETLYKTWKTYVENLSKISISFQRKIGNFKRPVLHVFADASKRTFGAVAYFAENGETSFVMAKSRLAPMKPPSLPQLELTALNIAARLANFIVSSYENELQIERIMLWSDSQITISWMKSNKVKTSYVCQRKENILKLCPNAEINHISGMENPSDLLTRGISASKFNENSLWFNGPNFIKNLEHVNCITTADPALDTECEIVSNLTTECEIVSNLITERSEPVIEVAKYSSYSKALRITAYVLKFISKIKRKTSHENCCIRRKICTNHLKEAEKILVKTYQQFHFGSVFDFFEGTCKSKPSIVNQLRLFLDDGLIKCDGRIQNSNVPECTKFPILLPSKSDLTNLIVIHNHRMSLHAGVNHLLAHLRGKWWIPRGRQVIKKVLKICVKCLKVQGQAYSRPVDPPLPASRITKVKPFQVCGIDYTGALTVKTRGGSDKAYIVLFTCAVSRAIHLEVVYSLSELDLLYAMIRFSSRRSYPQILYSDNATNMVAAAKTLDQISKTSSVRNFLTENRIEWRFITPRASWHGGMWERLIGMTKDTLKKVIGKSCLTPIELETLVTQIELKLNVRPLTYTSSDLSDLQPVTPSQLMLGFNLTEFPIVLKDDEINDPSFGSRDHVSKLIDYRSKILTEFWNRWQHEYLTSLRERHKIVFDGNLVPKLGDVVLVHENVPRTNWKLGMVEKLIPGSDSHVRTVQVRTSTGSIFRPVSKLYPLELNCETRAEMLEPNLAVQSRPRRLAAQKALDRLKEVV